MDKLRFDDTDQSVVAKNRKPSDPVEVSDLSRRSIEPDRAMAGLIQTAEAAFSSAEIYTNTSFRRPAAA